MTMEHRHGGAPKGCLVRMGIRAVAGGVGLASESVNAHTESKAGTDKNKHRNLDIGKDTGHDLEDERK
ncbi:hypothetical protein HO173_004578 [Letharia columbiana]|uniref:Uncharacterized protein n=1 Tax=Letharia columbiana TaxID=112416 RepID=A0A8H6FYF0_9LECA|nr:uncharacterized protein HO173_004578 [Letharia columbiana]KAF6237110.1 hypothetical protein HO173_004578 [Letharia columbiana]